MKQAISLLLACMLCLSLFACGTNEDVDSPASTSSDLIKEENTGESEEIVITIDNWQDYLEIKQAADWEGDERGCCIVFLIGLKEEYAGKQISADTTLEMEFTSSWVYKAFSCDKETKSYEIGDVIADKPGETVTMHRAFSPSLLEWQPSADVQAVLLVDGATDYYSYVKILEDFQVISVSGVIRFE